LLITSFLATKIAKIIDTMHIIRKKFSIFAQKSDMDILNYNQKIAVMRVLLDIIHADGRIDVRETSFFNKLLDELALPYDTKDEISRKSSLIALLDIKNFTGEQKEYFAALMDKMIKVDEDINVNEVAIYDVVIDYCKIPIPFAAG
jgi:hypothetical protein